MKSTQISTAPTAPWTAVCYGIDATPQGSCIAVRAERRGRRINFSTINFDSGELEKEISKGAAAAAGLSVRQGIATWISAPFASASKAAKVFPTLLDIQLPFQLDECIYDFTETVRFHNGDTELPVSSTTPQENLSSKKESTASLAVAARKCDVENRLTELADMGINPHVLDYEGLALWTQLLYEHPQTDSDKNAPLRIIVFMRGEEGILVIGRGRYFRTYHKINASTPSAIDRYLRVQINQLGFDPEFSPPRIEWFRGGTGFDYNQKGTDLKEHIEKNWPGSTTIFNDPETFLARALATRALLPGPMRTNLRTDSLAHTGADAHTNRAQKRSSAIIMFAGILLCCAPIIWEYHIAAQRKAFEKKFAACITEMLGYPAKAKGATALLIAERELENRTQKHNPLTQGFRPSLLTDMQLIVSAINKYDIKTEQLKLTATGFRIKGSATSKTDVKKLTSRFRSLGYNAEITTDDDKNPEKYIFILNAKRGDPNE
jgi:hypothetical protein